MNSSHKKGFIFCIAVYILTLASITVARAQDGYLSGMVVDSATQGTVGLCEYSL